MKEIQLTRGKVALVDDGDYDLLARNTWSAVHIRNSWYARSKAGFMHAVIMGRKWIDHIDGDGLNNQRDNLRAATNTQNQYNRGPQSNNTSGHKGVHWDSATQKWRAKINANGKRIHIGRFDTIEEATLAYAAAARELHGEFA